MKRETPGFKLIGATLLVIAILAGVIFVARDIAPPGTRPIEIPHEAARIVRDYEPPWTKPHIAWDTVDPHVQQFDKDRLDDLADALADMRTRALLVVRGDRIVSEWYAAGSGGANTRHSTASMAKQLVGATALFVALSDDKLSLDDAASKYIPTWTEDPLKSRITIRDLANHSSGLQHPARAGIPVDQLEEWQQRYWRRDPDSVTVAINAAPVIFEPGSRHAYSGPGMSALGYAITASVSRDQNIDLRTLLDSRVMQRIGVPETDWRIGYGERYNIDGLHVYEIRGGARYTARAIARIGQLILNEGNWHGEQLIDREVIDMIAPDRRQPLPELRAGLPRPGIGGWFTNVEGQWPALPRDALVSAGAGHKFLLVIPSKDLVVVRIGDALEEHVAFGEADFWSQAEHHLFNPLMAALTAPPYPPSTVISRIRWSPEITRLAEGSDNWPLTWADDDHQYTAYGDGWGFAPRVPEEKLSLGVARVEGFPTDLRTINIPSPTAEQFGGGRTGMKASGMLMVDGILYMWVRNADLDGNQCRLAWSADRGTTWTWNDWKFAEFGYCAFLNYGKDYAGAPDEFVYMYAPNTPNAYEETDDAILTRVDKRRIRDREYYEFFAGTDAQGAPIWTAEISDRRPVFTMAGAVNRMDAVFYPPLQRYLLMMSSLGRADGIKHFSIFDAPQPWGPWTTVFTSYNSRDSKPETIEKNWGEAQHIPTKWISADGSSFYLVFSGVDTFSIRKGHIDINAPDDNRH